MDCGDDVLSRLRESLEQTRTLYEGARQELQRASELYIKLGGTPPDGSLWYTLQRCNYTFYSYTEALTRYNSFLVGGEVPDEEGPEDSTTQI